MILEALATGCSSTSAYISIHNMCSWLLDVYGTAPQKDKWLNSVCTFELLTSYCLTEPGCGSDAKAMKTYAVSQNDGYTLNGNKMFISGGDSSDLFLVMAKTEGNTISCFLIEKGTTGLSFGKREGKLGWRTQPTQLLQLDNCWVPNIHLLGKLGDGMKIAMTGLEGGRLTISSIALGGAWDALERAREYMEQRKAFKTQLKGFQFLRFQMAEALAELTSARMTVRECAKIMDQDVDNKHIYSSIAKLIATERAFTIAHNCMQMFGGYGLMNEYQIERIFREMRVLHVVEGTNEIMKHTIAKALFPS